MLTKGLFRSYQGIFSDELLPLTSVVFDSDSAWMTAWKACTDISSAEAYVRNAADFICDGHFGTRRKMMVKL